MKLAIVGSGISGLTCAYFLSRKHDVTLFEAGDHIGGHTNTITVQDESGELAIDTGFIVFNDDNYPNLCKLFDQLGVASRDSDMSLSVRCEQTGLEYNGSSLAKIFTQKKNLLKPTFLRMLLEIRRFNKQAVEDLAVLDDVTTVSSYLQNNGYSSSFISQYFLPLGASLWSCETRQLMQYPVRFVIEFLHNHQMLKGFDRPVWKTVRDGSNTYVKKMLADMNANIRKQTPVVAVKRNGPGVEIVYKNCANAGNTTDYFDEAIIACHADQSLALLDYKTETEQDLLSYFPYQKNDVVLHTDTSLLPQSRNAWASWNYLIPVNPKDTVSVTYNMNMLQGLESKKTYMVSLNQTDKIDRQSVVKRIQYEHPSFKPDRKTAQKQHESLIRHHALSYCGAYWGYGFHEDGISSALRVCEAYDCGL